MLSRSTPPLHVAIVGGGITGLCLGIGLHVRNISFTIYERASRIQDAGAGIGLSPNAEWAMKVLSPQVHAAYEKVANPNGEDYFQWVNGVSKELIFKLFTGEGCFRGCRRSDLLEKLTLSLTKEQVKFGKVVESTRNGDKGGVVLRFSDGSEEIADTVIACDGINSRLRSQLFPPPRSVAATYTHKTSFRALIPISHARTTLGLAMVSTRYMYNGPGAHIITYPVAGDTLLNVLVVISDPSHPSQHTRTVKRAEAERAFEDWHADVRAIVGLLPDEMEQWAIFDMYEGPAPRYHEGRVCLAGDAAHAVGPHLGAGAGYGIEDAALLTELFLGVQERAMGERDGGKMSSLLEAAYSVYTEMRYERTQWLVRETREAVDLFEWDDPAVAKDPVAFGKEVTWRYHTIWDYDIGKMVDNSKIKFDAAVRGTRAEP